MSQSTSSDLQDRSRLVNLLTQLTDFKLGSARYNLAERLGHLVGVSGSMDLARGLRQLPQQASQSKNTDVVVLQDDFLSTRVRMMNTIIDSFSPESGDPQKKVPSEATGIRAEALKTFAPYKRFYTTHQIEIAVGVKNLRTRIRVGMSSFSAQMHQLAELDSTLDQSLEVHARKLFDAIPKLLEPRFQELLKQHQENDEATQWLELFHQDMRELLLAELDVRLQPVLGLLEAINEQTDFIS